MTKTIMTPRKEAILRMLEADYDEGGQDSLASEFGRPPLTATTIAQYIDWFDGDNGREWNEMPDGSKNAVDPMWRVPAGTVQSFARTLRAMAKEGLLVSVREKQLTFNCIGGNYVDMPQTCYFSAKTMEHKVGSAYAHNSQVLGQVIDGYISEVSPADDTFSGAAACALCGGA
jgi:hypothetical protein